MPSSSTTTEPELCLFAHMEQGLGTQWESHRGRYGERKGYHRGRASLPVRQRAVQYKNCPNFRFWLHRSARHGFMLRPRPGPAAARGAKHVAMLTIRFSCSRNVRQACRVTVSGCMCTSASYSRLRCGGSGGSRHCWPPCNRHDGTRSGGMRNEKATWLCRALKYMAPR